MEERLAGRLEVWAREEREKVEAEKERKHLFLGLRAPAFSFPSVVSIEC